MAEKIVITSGKGGVGKTTVTANLGRAIADRGMSVVMIDVDFGLNNLDVVMGVENKVVYDFSDVINGRCRARQALVRANEKSNLYLMPSNGLTADGRITGQNLKLVVEGLAPSFDYVLIDCPAGIDTGFHRAVAAADKALVVTTPSLPSLRDADKVITILKSYRLNGVRLVVNRARGDLMLSDKMMYPKDVRDLLKTDIIGVLPEEDAVFLSGGKELPRRSDSRVAYKLLAENVVTGSSKIFNVFGKYSGFWGSIRRSVKSGL